MPLNKKLIVSSSVAAYAVLCMGCALLALLSTYLLNVAMLGIDDAYIFFVYAKHFALGEGFVYNPGGEPVEGFSSLAWVLLLALFDWLRISGPVVWFAVCVALAALGLTAVYLSVLKMTRVAGQAPQVAVLIWAAWMLASPSWFLWNVAAFMDVVLWGCLISLFVALYVRLVFLQKPSHPLLITCLLAVMLVSRPESLAWVPFFIAALAWLARYKRWPVIPFISAPVIVCLITVVLLTAFRQSYFGYPLPNTYYAKVSPDIFYNLRQGFVYVYEYALGSGIAFILWLAALLTLLWRIPILIRQLFGKPVELEPISIVTCFLSATLVFSVLIAIWVGGDHFGGARLFQPYYPLLCLFGLSLWLERGHSLPGLSLAKCVWLFLGAFIVFSAPVRAAWHNINRSHLQIDFDIAQEGRVKAGVLAEMVRNAGESSYPVIGSINAGGLKYYWPGAVFDLMGLNDAEMAHAGTAREGKNAHAAFDTDVFLRRQPEIMLPYIEQWSSGVSDCAEVRDPEGFYWQVLDGLQGRTDFNAAYTYVTLPSSYGSLCMYIRNDYLKRINASGFTGLLPGERQNKNL